MGRNALVQKPKSLNEGYDLNTAIMPASRLRENIGSALNLIVIGIDMLNM